jgi:hypothetical protein
MKQRSMKSRGPAKPVDTDCTLASHQTLARTTQFKICPECGEQLGPHRQFPVEPDVVSQAITSMASEDEQFVSSMTGAVREFIRGMAGFFLEAQSIEQDARSTLAQFNGYQQPTSLEEDEILVSRIRSANVAYDIATKHWEPVTSLFNALHKRVVAGRKRPQELLTDAVNRGNRLHNAWDAIAEQRKRDKEEAERRENERIAREQRDAEIREMEEKALLAEANADNLSDREQAFVNLMLQNYPPHVAATRAGFSKTNNGKDAADRLLGLVKIVNSIEGYKKAAAIRQQAAAVQHAPLETRTVETVKKEVASGSRASRSAVVFDESAFMAALLDPTQRLHFGIPAEIATFSQTKLNQQARTLDKQINRWPGVRLDVDKSVV